MQDLHTQLSAYRTRHAAFSDLRVAELLAEVHARSLASSSPRLSRAQILGTGEKASTRIRLTRLTALGARLTRMDDAVSATVYLVGDSIPMVIHRSWPVDDDPGFAGEVVGRRRIAGTTLERLASSSVVTESAVRHANRGLELTRSAMAKTSVLPLGRAWESLPDHLAHHEDSSGRGSRPSSSGCSRCTGWCPCPTPPAISAWWPRLPTLTTAGHSSPTNIAQWHREPSMPCTAP
ncbi:Uncharacterised protein [Mycobacteroides abscessus subsp. abscessus]|nr:Uncharacterised protein [Mycobacteroides abscessus subsp. abscessus]